MGVFAASNQLNLTGSHRHILPDATKERLYEIHFHHMIQPRQEWMTFTHSLRTLLSHNPTTVQAAHMLAKLSSNR